jgi:ATP adenylyltransferase
MSVPTPPAGGEDAGGPRPMDRLWAGWRSSYVAAAGNGALAGEGSIFCRILASGLPDDETHIVWRGETTFAILNAFPYTSGHLLLMPYREVPDLEHLRDDESAELWSAVRSAVAAIKAAYHPQGVNVGLNLGEAAGAGIPSHLHVHVLPRWNADSNFMTSVAEARVLPESLGDSWQRLRAAWPTGDG